MKKVGILTYHYAENRNFGTILQAYSLSITISKLGYETRLINFLKLQNLIKNLKS